MSRFRTLSVSLLALAVAFGSAVPASAAKKQADVSSVTPKDFDNGGFKFLKKADRIAVPGFRVIFVVRNKATARAGSALANFGNTAASGSGMKTVTQAKNASLEIILAGVDEARLQKIAEQAYSDFVEQVKASGREVLTAADLAGNAGFEALEKSALPTYRKEPSLSNPKGYVTATPTNVPLWFTGSDAAYGDKSAFFQANNKALNKLAIEAKAVVVVPQIVIDFAKLASSGSSMLRSDAEVSSDKGMTVIGNEFASTGLHIYKSINKFAADWRFARLEKSFSLDGDYGDIKVITAENDANFQNSMTMAFGGQGTQHFKEMQALVADPAKYEALAVEAAKAVNKVFGQILTENK